MTDFGETLTGLVVDALETINVEDGYSFDVLKVQRFDRGDLTTEPGTINVMRMQPSYARDGGAYSVTTMLLLLCYLSDPSTGTTEEAELAAGTDVLYVLSQLETNDPENFRATIDEIVPAPFSEEAGDDGVDIGVAVSVTLKYRVDFMNPCTPIDPE